MTTMAIEMVGTTAVVVYGSSTPSDQDYAHALQVLESNAKTMTGAIAYSLGGGPSSTQRHRAAKLWLSTPSKPRVALCSNSPVVHGMFTAVAWLIGSNIKAFALEDIPGAALHVNTSSGIAQHAIQKMLAKLDRSPP